MWEWVLTFFSFMKSLKPVAGRLSCLISSIRFVKSIRLVIWMSFESVRLIMNFKVKLSAAKKPLLFPMQYVSLLVLLILFMALSTRFWSVWSLCRKKTQFLGVAFAFFCLFYHLQEAGGVEYSIARPWCPCCHWSCLTLSLLMIQRGSDLQLA